MNTVQPIRDKKKISAMKTLLKAKNEKYYLMFRIGVNVGLRVSDILTLKVGDVRAKDHVTICEKKTGKAKRFLVPATLQKEIALYIKENNMSDEEYLIQSRKGNNKPITRIQAYRVLNEVAEQIGIDEVGTHTMRKTFGYHQMALSNNSPRKLLLLQKMFGHSSAVQTLSYIGLTEEEITDAYLNLNLGSDSVYSKSINSE